MDGLTDYRESAMGTVRDQAPARKYLEKTHQNKRGDGTAKTTALPMK